jgi:hypothetical protein
MYPIDSVSLPIHLNFVILLLLLPRPVLFELTVANHHEVPVSLVGTGQIIVDVQGLATFRFVGTLSHLAVLLHEFPLLLLDHEVSILYVELRRILHIQVHIVWQGQIFLIMLLSVEGGMRG